MKTVLLLVLSAILVSSEREKRGTKYYRNPQQPYSYSHFTQELPTSEGHIKLLPAVQKTPVEQLTIVPVYIERPVPVPLQVPLLPQVPFLYQYQGDLKHNTFPHLKPYYKQVA